MEEWRKVQGVEPWYEVSSLGRVRSIDREIKDKTGNRTRRFKGQILKGVPVSDKGHLSICIYRNQKRKPVLIHRLVAEAFLPNPLNLDIVDHIDGDSTNNRLSNLRWATASHNNANTPYVRYLISVLQEAGIDFISQEQFYES